MKTIIIEDEKAAVRNLKALLQEVNPGIEVETSLDSIASSLDWFATHPMPDLLFMDIHLADGSAFEIFDHVDITCPIIFTTAYDEYALRAFKVNSVDYLLKPIARERLQATLQRLQARAGKGTVGDGALAGLLQQLSSALPAAAKSPPLVWLTASSGKDTRLIMVEDIAYFQSDTKYTAVMTADGEALAQFGWCFHTHGKAKTGYMGRMGLYRVLAWPFIYKAYAIGDFAEFLETFGLPIITGKYFAGASDEEKASLLRAVTALGHDARAIMPADMEIEIATASTSGKVASINRAKVRRARPASDNGSQPLAGKGGE